MPFLRAALGVVARLADVLERTSLYVAAAIRPLRDVQAAESDYWSDFGMSDDHLERGFFRWERELADRYARPGARILLVGCGSGRDLRRLLERGCVVTGVDMAEAPLRRAREKLAEKGLTARLIHARIEDVPLDQQYDIVWFSWLSYSYIPMSARRIRTLGRLLPHLAPGGVVAVNVLGNAPDNFAIPLARAAARLTRSDWQLEPGDTLTRLERPDRYHFEHCFAAGEVEGEFAAAGLDVAAVLGGGATFVGVPAAAARPSVLAAS